MKPLPPEPFRTIFENFDVMFGISLAWCLLWFGFFAWRRYRHKPDYPPIPEGSVRFQESFVSGRSMRSAFTMLMSARNALTVVVSDKAILIEPLGIFKWIMPMGFGNLEHYILKENIRSVQPITRFSRDGVSLEFEKNGERQKFELFLRSRDQFLANVR